MAASDLRGSYRHTVRGQAICSRVALTFLPIDLRAKQFREFQHRPDTGRLRNMSQGHGLIGQQGGGQQMDGGVAAAGRCVHAVERVTALYSNTHDVDFPCRVLVLDLSSSRTSRRSSLFRR